MTMYDLLNDFLDDEEILLSNLKDQMIDEVHTSVSSQEYAKMLVYPMQLGTLNIR